VMPREFNFPLRRGAVHTPSPYVDFWAPLRSGRAVSATEAVGVVARLRPGVSLLRRSRISLPSAATLAGNFPQPTATIACAWAFCATGPWGVRRRLSFF
jgi:hypothetical protein